MRKRDSKFPDNGFEAWGGYMQAKISKLEDQFVDRVGRDTNTLSSIFNGICIYVNGYTDPCADDLKSLMAQHGGIYHTYQRSDDYIIASNLPDTKVKKMNLSKVVRPEWITDSIANNRLLDYRDYLLYTNTKSQPKLTFKSTDTSITNKTDINIECTNKTSIPSTSTKTAVDPNFISEFYSNSRLHHISQLGAGYKQYINDLRDSSDFVFPAREYLKSRIKDTSIHQTISFQGKKVIMHIDMDCFFVSVGLRGRSDLKGKPIAVTHSKGGTAQNKRSGVDRDKEFSLYKQKFAKKISNATGKPEDEINMETRVDNIADEGDKYGSMSEIASCSYEARAKGVKNGMFMGNALRLCPDLQTIPYDFEGYKEVSKILYDTVSQYTLDIEAISCDEMYVDCTELLKCIGMTVQDFSRILREEIKEKTGCPCSTGFGGNRLQARLATKQAKPDGQFFLSEELVEDYMFDIKLKDLPGVGRQTSQKLETLGHETCGSLRTVPLNVLQKNLGHKTGLQLYEQCRGLDPNPLSFHNVRKSVSAEVNYGIRFENMEQCNEFIKQLSTEVSSRMSQYKVIGKCLTLKLMIRDENAPVETAKFLGHGFCNVVNKSCILAKTTNDSAVIQAEVVNLLKKQQLDPKDLRGIGIQMSKLESENCKQVKNSVINFFKTANNAVPSTSKQTSVDIKTEPVTPKKNLISPKKIKSQEKRLNKSPLKSPEKKINRSPAKRRGRPPKNLSLKSNSTSSQNNLSKFLNITNFNENIAETKRDIFKEEKETINTVKDNKTAENKTPNLNKKPSEYQENNSHLQDLPWKKVRELIRAWIESGIAPLSCDIQLVTTYIRELVVQRKIQEANILVKFLLRRSQEMNTEIWRNTCDVIVEEVQEAMRAIYGKQLFIS